MSDHMKRLAAPRTWPLKRKASVWATKQSPGAHSVEDSMPAAMVLRDMAGVCDTAREAKRIIGNRELLVDGKPVKNPKAPIGVMDVVSIPKSGLNFRMLLTDKGKLTLVPIKDDEAKFKLCRIENKTIIAGGKTQLNLSGGRNIVLGENKYTVGDTLKLAVPEQTVTGHYSFTKGSSVLVVSGAQTGRTEQIAEHVVVKGSADDIIVFTDGSETVSRNIFVIGDSKPAITLPEASQ